MEKGRERLPLPLPGDGGCDGGECGEREGARLCGRLVLVDMGVVWGGWLVLVLVLGAASSGDFFGKSSRRNDDAFDSDRRLSADRRLSLEGRRSSSNDDRSLAAADTSALSADRMETGKGHK